MSKKLLLIVMLIMAGMWVAPANAQSFLKKGKVPKDTEIKLERTVCFGACPAYTLTITADGKVAFVGKRFTIVSGEATGKITQTKIKQILAYADSIKFIKMRDQYVTAEDGCTSMISDAPAEIISINANDRNKAVNHYFGCRDVKGNPDLKVAKLGALIDKLTRSIRWAKSTGLNPGGLKPPEGDTGPVKKP